MKSKGTKGARTILKNKNKVGALIFLKNTYNNATVNKTVQY